MIIRGFGDAESDWLEREVAVLEMRFRRRANESAGLLADARDQYDTPMSGVLEEVAVAEVLPPMMFRFIGVIGCRGVIAPGSRAVMGALACITVR